MGMQIESIRLKNFKTFRDVTIAGISRFSVFVGANGTGKSTLFDVFGFLKDSLLHNVRQSLARRGGFKEMVSRGTRGPIEIEIKFRENNSPLVTYFLQIGEVKGQAVVEREILRYRRGRYGKPWNYLDFSRGQGKAIVNEEQFGKPDIEAEREPQKLDAPDILAIKGLGQFARFQAAAAFRKTIENWHVSDFHISDARPSQEAGYAEHLSQRGDNLPLVAQYMYEHHQELFKVVLAKMAERVPGVASVEAAETEDGRIVLKFQDGSFKDPFIAKYVSDGTIKMFAYLVLLHDPAPHPLLCIEEPENQLYPHLLRELAEEFRVYGQKGGQVFVSTHSPDFLNGALLQEIFWIEKRDGYSQVFRVADNPLAHDLAAEGDLPGALWKQGLFRGV